MTSSQHTQLATIGRKRATAIAAGGPSSVRRRSNSGKGSFAEPVKRLEAETPLLATRTALDEAHVVGIEGNTRRGAESRALPHAAIGKSGQSCDDKLHAHSASSLARHLFVSLPVVANPSWHVDMPLRRCRQTRLWAANESRPLASPMHLEKRQPARA